MVSLATSKCRDGVFVSLPVQTATDRSARGCAAARPYTGAVWGSSFPQCLINVLSTVEIFSTSDEGFMAVVELQAV